MINRGVVGCQVEKRIEEGAPGSRGQAQERLKLPRPLLQGKGRITKNTQPGPRRPSRLPDKLQIIHRLLLGTLLAIPVTNFSLGFQKCQPLQGEHRPDHVFSDPLGLSFCLGPDEGQNHRVRQENMTSRSCLRSGQRIRANPQRGLPQSRRRCEERSDVAISYPSRGNLGSPRSLRSLVMTCGHLLDNGPEEAVLPLETALIFCQEPVEVMK